MRIALDSSVLIAAHISRAGVCAELLEDVLLHQELVTSEFILEELTGKLLEKCGFPKCEADSVAAFLRRVCVVVAPDDLTAEVCRDSSDITVLGSAIAGECTLLISVDRDLRDMQQFKEIPIIRPGEYWRRTMDASQGKT